MAIREVTTQPDGTRTTRMLPGYESKPKHNVLKMPHKETTMKPAAKTKPQPKAAPKEQPHKSAFKATIMALNDDNAYIKANEIEAEVATEIRTALDKWLKGGGIGQFNIYRRK